MRINSINSTKKANQTFAGTSERKNHYETCNTGKFIGVGLTVGAIAEKIFNKGGFKAFSKDFDKELATSLSEEATKATKNKIEITDLTTQTFKNMSRLNLVSYIAIFAICCIGGGAILDSVINAQRSGKADGHYI